MQFKYLEYLEKDLRIKYEPYIHTFQNQKEMIQFIHEINIEDSPIPQIVVLSLATGDFLPDIHLDELFKDHMLKQGCYEPIFQTMFDIKGLHEYKWRQIYRIKP